MRVGVSRNHSQKRASMNITRPTGMQSIGVLANDSFLVVR